MPLEEFPLSLSPNQYPSEYRFNSGLSVSECYAKVMQLKANGAYAKLGFLKVDDYSHAIPEKDLATIDVHELAEKGISARIITVNITSNNSGLDITFDNMSQGMEGYDTGSNVRVVVPTGHALEEYFNVSTIQELQSSLS